MSTVLPNNNNNNSKYKLKKVTFGGKDMFMA